MMSRWRSLVAGSSAESQSRIRRFGAADVDWLRSLADGARGDRLLDMFLARAVHGAEAGSLGFHDKKQLLFVVVGRNSRLCGLDVCEEAPITHRVAEARDESELRDLALAFVRSYLRVDDLIRDAVIASTRGAAA